MSTHDEIHLTLEILRTILLFGCAVVLVLWVRGSLRDLSQDVRAIRLLLRTRGEPRP